MTETLSFIGRRVLLGAVVMLMGASCLHAQDTLSLAGAIAIGLKNNYDIILSDGEVEITRNNNNPGEAGRYPTINLSANQRNRLTDVNNPTSFVQGKLTNLSASPQADLNWVLFEGFKVGITLDQLQHLQEQSEGQAALVVENTVQAIILGYYDCLLARENLVTLENQKALSRDQYDYVSYKRELGVGTSFDVLQEENAYLQDSSLVLQQELNIERTQRQLNLLLAVPAETKFTFTDEIYAPDLKFLYPDLEERMLANNQSLRNQYINQMLLKDETNLSKTARYPRLTMNPGTNYEWSYLERNSQTAIGNSYSYYLNFTLDYTLFDGGKINRRIENAETREGLGQVQTDQILFELKSSLRNNLELYDLLQKQYSLAVRRRESTNKNLTLAEERFRNGTISSFDFRQVQLRSLEANIECVDLQYQLIEAYTELTRLTGGLLGYR